MFAPNAHKFIATLVAAPGAVAKVSDLWSAYRGRLTARERRRVRRRDFVESLRSAGLVAIDREGSQVLAGFSLDPLPVVLVNPKTGRLIRA
jgi:hypothetical protein